MVEGRKYTKGSVQVTRMERKIDHDEGSDVSRTGQIGLERIKLQKVEELSRERSSKSESIGQRHLGWSNESQRELKAVSKLFQETLLTMER